MAEKTCHTIGRPWTPDEDRLLQESYGLTPTTDLARALGRTPSAIQQRAHALGRYWPPPAPPPEKCERCDGPMPPGDRPPGLRRFCSWACASGRCPPRTCDYCGKVFWPRVERQKFCSHACSNHTSTTEQRSLLRELWGKESHKEIARKLGMSDRSVHHLAYVLGLPRRPACLLDRTGIADRIRELNAEGYADVEAAHVLGVTADALRKARRALGLPSRKDHPRQRARLSAIHKRRFEEDRFASVGPKSERQRYLSQSGWPPDVGPHAVQILNLVAGAGIPLLSDEIFTSVGGNASCLRIRIANLKRRGLLVRLQGVRPDPHHSERVRDAYALGPVALSILRERAQCKSNDETPR
jgi:hypothetical protein